MLQVKRKAILAEEGFEDAEFLEPLRAMKGHRVTSWPSIAVDLKNAGALWVGQPVVQDGNLITSRKPADLPRFNKAIIQALQE